MGNRIEAIARRVRTARREQGLNQEDLAEQLGLTRSGYGHYESGRQEFSVNMLFSLSAILGRPVTWLLGIETDLAEDESELLHAYRSIEDEALRRLALKVVKEAAGIES